MYVKYFKMKAIYEFNTTKKCPEITTIKTIIKQKN